MTGTLTTRTCPECGQGFAVEKKKGAARVFCCDEHKATHAGRMTARGKALSKIALGWRLSRGSGDLGKYLFAEMTAMLDEWNAQDKAAGRMRADDYAALVTNFTPLSEASQKVYGGRTFIADRYMDRRN